MIPQTASRTRIAAFSDLARRVTLSVKLVAASRPNPDGLLK